MAECNINKNKYKCNDLSADFIRNILDYNPDTGIFIWKYRNDVDASTNSRFVGKVAGRKGSGGYWDIAIRYRRYQAHRLAWVYMTGKWPTEEIDHIDANKSNNAFTNLREATNSFNNCNKPTRKDNLLGLKGVRLHKHGRYQARIKINKKEIALGYFDTPHEAYQAYCNASKKYHAEYGKIQ